MKKYLPLALLGLIIGLVAYFNRWIFTYKFEPEYWENYYYESQWNVPNSKRQISDEGVYRYIGFRLVNGENPFNVDYWVPPLGKYWYGWGAKYLGNPYLISFFMYVVAIAIFGLLAKLVLKHKLIVWLCIYMFALNPLLVEQIGQTMLDLPMTIFFMLTIYGLLLAADYKKIIYVQFAGLSLGLMAGVKPPYFIPMIGLIGIVWLYWKKVKGWWYFPLFVPAGYLLAYTCYFIRHPNPIPFIRLHEKIIDFQKNNTGSSDVLNIFKVIFFNRYKGHWVDAKTISPLNWSLILPVGALGLFMLWTRLKQVIKENDKIFLLISLGTGYIIMNFYIDFWPRYLLPLIPIFTLIIGYLSRKKSWVAFVLLVGTLPSLYLLLFPGPEQILQDFESKQAGQLYRETYRMLDKSTVSRISESTWKEIGETIDVKHATPVNEGNQWKLRVEFSD